MNYTILKSVVVSVLLIAAFGAFFVRVRHLFRLMQAVTGKSEFTVDRIGQRIKTLFTDVLGQSNVRRTPMIGWAHTLIFFGFLAIQPHSLELMLKGVCPYVDVARYLPNLYSGYLYITDILAFLVLIGFGYALYRRLLIRPKHLTLGMDANLIILFTCLIVVTFHFINAFQLLLPSEEGFHFAGLFPVSSRLIPLLNLTALAPDQIKWGYEICYWLHIGTILGFLMYIPGSKHLHLLAAAPNVFLKPMDRQKSIVKTDIEDEDAETFGLGNVSELNWKNVLNLYACTECGRCEEQCPAAGTGKPLSPKAVVHDFKVDLLDQADAVLAKKSAEILPIVRDGSPVTGDVLFACTTCRACENICPVNIEHLDLIIEARKHRVLMEADFPPEIQETFTNLENQFNPWGFSSDTRADWAKDLDVPLMMDAPQAELLYFVGCSGSFDDRGKKVAQSIARLLKRADVNFAILGPEEACNGDIARRAGNEYIAQMLIRQNVEVLDQYKPRKILAGCPHCYNSLKVEFPQFGAHYDVVHHSQFLSDLIRRGRLPAAQKIGGTLTFHDSCYLGRWNGIYEEPRILLENTVAGARLTELPRSKSNGFCCGAGGGRMFMEETGDYINVDRAKEVAASGADTVAAACPFCITMLRDGLLEIKSETQVKDIAELLDEATA